jgi:hypothetical protein
MLRCVRSKSALVSLMLALVAAAAVSASAPASISHRRPPTLEFRGQVILPTDTMFEGTQVGGVSGIQYAGRSTFYSLSDDPSQFGPARLCSGRGRPDRQYLYFTETIAEPPVPATNFAVNGLVDLLPLGKKSMLTMERSFSVGAPGTGNKVKLFRVALKGADDISRFNSLAGLFGAIDPVQKTLLLDLDVLGILLDNVEGMTFGPTLRDGRRTLLLVSDNNFAATQFTQFLLFAYGSDKDGDD